jgi:hypothetical protein
MAHEGDDSQAKRKRRPRLASDLLEPGMVIAHPSGLEEALAREFDVDDPFGGNEPLDADAFEPGRVKAAPPPRASSTELYEPPTVRLDLEGPPLPDPATQEIPMPAPRRLLVREPTVVKPELIMPPPGPAPPLPREIPLSLPLPAPPPISSLPLGAQPASKVAAPAAAVRVNLPCNLLIVDQDLRAGSQLAAKLIELGYTCRVVGDGLVEAALAQQRYDAAIIEVPAEEASHDRGLSRLGKLATYSGPIVLTSAALLPLGSYGPPHRVRASLQRPFFTESLVAAIEDVRAQPSLSTPPAKAVAPAAFPTAPPPPPLKPVRSVSPAPKTPPISELPRPLKLPTSPPVAVKVPTIPPTAAPPQKSRAASPSTRPPQGAPSPKTGAPKPIAVPGPTPMAKGDGIVGIPLATEPPSAPPSSEPAGDQDTGPIFPPGPEQAALHELDVNVVRAVLIEDQRANARGRVRAMSMSGRMLVEAKEPFDEGTQVAVELTTTFGLRAELLGQVVGATDTEMGIELKIPADQQKAVRRFLDEARDVTQPTIEQVRIKAQATVVPLEEKPADDAALDLRWREVKDHLEDDARQQRFIQECLKAQRLEFAVQCYRALKAERPEDPTAAKYLQQVGTILSFYAFRKQAVEPEKGMSRGLKVTLVAFVIAALMITVIVEMLR